MVVETSGTRICMPVVSLGVVDGLSTLVATPGKVGCPPSAPHDPSFVVSLTHASCVRDVGA
jgi:hypothetical protein